MGNGWVLQSRLKAHVLQPMKAGHHGDVGQGEIAQQPRPTELGEVAIGRGKALAKGIQGAFQGLRRQFAGALLPQPHEQFAAHGDGMARHVGSHGGHWLAFQQLGKDGQGQHRNRRAERGPQATAVVEHAELKPLFGERLLRGLGGPQALAALRVRLIDVFDDAMRVIDRLAVVDQGRHLALGVDRQMLWGQVLAVGVHVAQHDVVRFERQPFFKEAEPGLLRAQRLVAVVKLELLLPRDGHGARLLDAETR